MKKTLERNFAATDVTFGQQVVTQTITIWPVACTPVSDAAFTWMPVTPSVGEVVVFTGTATGTLQAASATWIGAVNADTV